MVQILGFKMKIIAVVATYAYSMVRSLLRGNLKPVFIQTDIRTRYISKNLLKTVILICLGSFPHIY